MIRKKWYGVSELKYLYLVVMGEDLWDVTSRKRYIQIEFERQKNPTSVMTASYNQNFYFLSGIVFEIMDHFYSNRFQHTDGYKNSGSQRLSYSCWNGQGTSQIWTPIRHLLFRQETLLHMSRPSNKRDLIEAIIVSWLYIIKKEELKYWLSQYHVTVLLCCKFKDIQRNTDKAVTS